VDDIVQIPYIIDSVFDSSEQQLIEESLLDLENKAKVIHFVQKTTESAFVIVVDTSGGCSSIVGKSPFGKSQDLNLGPGCVTKYIIQHEFLHAIGFQHEQVRPDRDNYVRINFDNIEPKHVHNFDISTSSVLLGADYEYGSVMHYPSNAFAINKDIDTITALQSDVALGSTDGATEVDILEVQLLYQCISGPRTYQDYQSNLCTSDCKCWEGANGCNGDDNACQGSLICSDNVCTVNNGGGGGSEYCGNGSIGNGVCADGTVSIIC
jgi:Astacin (Peptidase family M12A)